MAQLRRGDLKEIVFKNEIPQKIAISEAPIDSKPFITSPTAKKKQDWSVTLKMLEKVTDELVQKTS
jgi:chromosome partitioning protein